MIFILGPNHLAGEAAHLAGLESHEWAALNDLRRLAGCDRPHIVRVDRVQVPADLSSFADALGATWWTELDLMEGKVPK